MTTIKESQLEVTRLLENLRVNHIQTSFHQESILDMKGIALNFKRKIKSLQAKVRYRNKLLDECDKREEVRSGIISEGIEKIQEKNASLRLDVEKYKEVNVSAHHLIQSLKKTNKSLKNEVDTVRGVNEELSGRFTQLYMDSKKENDINKTLRNRIESDEEQKYQLINEIDKEREAAFKGLNNFSRMVVQRNRVIAVLIGFWTLTTILWIVVSNQ